MITEVASQLRIQLSLRQVADLDEFAERLLAANVRAGLTSSATDRAHLYRRHLAESLALLALLRREEIALSPLIDVGSGGGLPGIPVAIAEPAARVTLLEATRKKADFLRDVARGMDLPQLDVVNARAEVAAHSEEHREKYRLAVARAVAPLPVLLEYALPFVRPGGVLAAPKGSGVQREVAAAEHALEVLGGTVEALHPLPVPGREGPVQTVVIVRKTGRTPSGYPRRTGVPARRPL